VRRDVVFDQRATSAWFDELTDPWFCLRNMLIYLFGVELRWLPAGGFAPLSGGLAQNLRSMLLPAIALGTFASTQLMRYLRAGMLDVLNADYIRTARAKGLAAAMVLVRHAMR